MNIGWPRRGSTACARRKRRSVKARRNSPTIRWKVWSRCRHRALVCLVRACLEQPAVPAVLPRSSSTPSIILLGGKLSGICSNMASHRAIKRSCSFSFGAITRTIRKPTPVRTPTIRIRRILRSFPAARRKPARPKGGPFWCARPPELVVSRQTAQRGERVVVRTGFTAPNTTMPTITAAPANVITSFAMSPPSSWCSAYYVSGGMTDCAWLVRLVLRTARSEVSRLEAPPCGPRQICLLWELPGFSHGRPESALRDRHHAENYAQNDVCPEESAAPHRTTALGRRDARAVMRQDGRAARGDPSGARDPPLSLVGSSRPWRPGSLLVLTGAVECGRAGLPARWSGRKEASS